MRGLLCIAAGLVSVSSSNPTREIEPGVMMPLLSAGHPDDGTSESGQAELWFKLGGRGIDTAYSYHNQADVGKAVRESGLNRTDIFITSKINPGRYDGSCTVANTVAAVQEDLKELNLPYVDLMLIHFPCPTLAQTKLAWQGLEQILQQKLARSIGVSNFKKDDLDAVLSLGGSVPALNQCAMSIGAHDDATIAYCKSLNITYEAYSPLRKVDLGGAAITGIAKAHGVSTAQVALRWVDQLEVQIAVSPGTNQQYAKEDLALRSFELTSGEVEALSAL